MIKGAGLGGDLGTVALVPDCPGGLLVVQSVDRRLVPHRKPPAVGVDGQLDRRVTQLPLDVGRADLGGEEQGGEGVAKPVGREVEREPRGLPESLPGPTLALAGSACRALESGHPGNAPAGLTAGSGGGHETGFGPVPTTKRTLLDAVTGSMIPRLNVRPHRHRAPTRRQ